MIKVPKERRRDKRRLDMSMPCVILTDHKTSEAGTTFNISEGGMCVFSDKSLDAGRVIDIQCRALWDQPKTGTVKWCRKIKHDLYRIGISFS